MMRHNNGKDDNTFGDRFPSEIQNAHRSSLKHGSNETPIDLCIGTLAYDLDEQKTSDAVMRQHAVCGYSLYSAGNNLTDSEQKEFRPGHRKTLVESP
jgi:hypothetical protein